VPCGAVQRQNILDGRYVGRLAPYGYAKSPKDCRKLIVDEEFAPVVRQIFELASAGEGVFPIARLLCENGIDPPSHRNHAKGFNTSEKLLGSKYWKHSIVKNILTDRVYVGDMVQGKTRTVNGKQIDVPKSEWVCVENTHEPIIDRVLFERVQIRFQNITEKMTSEILSMLLKYSEVVFGKYLRLERIASDTNNLTAQELREINQNLDRDGRMLKSLYESLVSGLLTSDEFVKMKSDYEVRIAYLSNRADELRNQNYQNKANAAEYMDFTDAVIAITKNRELTAEIVDKLVDNVIIRSDKSFEITFNFADEIREVRRCG